MFRPRGKSLEEETVITFFWPEISYFLLAPRDDEEEGWNSLPSREEEDFCHKKVGKMKKLEMEIFFLASGNWRFFSINIKWGEKPLSINFARHTRKFIFQAGKLFKRYLVCKLKRPSCIINLGNHGKAEASISRQMAYKLHVAPEAQWLQAKNGWVNSKHEKKIYPHQEVLWTENWILWLHLFLTQQSYII